MGKKAILLATNNRHKQTEIAQVLDGYDVLIPADRGISFSCEETGTTFLENALLKARALAAVTDLPVIADDSGLCVLALNGQPGVRSARFGSELPRPPQTDAERNAYLLSLLPEDETPNAFFVCSMVLLLDHYRFFTAQETVHGKIIRTPRGRGGFGYDPIFHIAELDKTAAELTLQEKNRFSHRGRAAAVIKLMLDRIA